MAASKAKATRKAAAPWQRDNPKAGGEHTPLSPQAKAAAKRRAQKAGRPYPNLVDNMHAAEGSAGKKKKAPAKKAAAAKPAAKRAAAAKTAPAEKAPARKAPAKKTAAKKTAAKKTPARKTPAKKTSASKSATKDPKGGLTAAGRAEFARKDGAQLKPGVTKPVSEMTPAEMRRKGSWAVRFYGRETLPALKKADGEPTRFALSAHAWGEPVPKTEAQARKIAAKGQALLKRYAAAKAKAAKAKAKAGKEKA